MKTSHTAAASSVSPTPSPSSRGRAPRLLLLASTLLLAALLAGPALAQKPDALWQTYMDAAWKADERGNFAEAEKFYKLAQTRAAAFDELDERRVFMWGRLAVLYLKWEGKSAEAAPLYKQIVDALDKGAGADSLMNAARVFELANAYQKRRRLNEAEPLYMHALAIYKRGMKPGDMRVTEYMYHLGSNYFSQGKNKDAERVFKENVEILNRDPHLSSQSTAYFSHGMLMLILRNEKRYDEAEQYITHALKITENYHGKNHPATASMLRAMHLLYDVQESRQADAEDVLKRSLRINELVFGPDSADVAQDLTWLAQHYVGRSMHAEAAAQFTRALGILEKSPTATLAEIDNIKVNIVDAQVLMRDYAAAEVTCRRVGLLMEKRFPSDQGIKLLTNNCLELVHNMSGDYSTEADVVKDSIRFAETRGSMEGYLVEKYNNLGNANVRQKRYADALTAYGRAEEINSKTPTPSAFYTANGKGRAYYFLGKYAEAESQFQKALDALKGKQDRGSLNTAAWFKKGYALVLYALGKTAQAGEMFEQAVENFKTDRVNGERDLGWSYHELATLFASQGKHAEAEPLFRRALALREKVYDPNHPELAATLEGLAALLIKTDRRQEAAQLEQRARSIREKRAAR